jgi:SAM-dependent methyltransferase
MEKEATALMHWQARIDACRRARPESVETVWERLAIWYNRWTAYNDYVSLVWPRLSGLMGPAARILEIGPGTGAFTIPLAQSAGDIVAVEPSANMRAALRANIEAAGARNIRVVGQRVEDAVEELAGPFDLALASHALYDVRDIDMLIERLLRLASHTVILMGTGDRREWERDLHRRLTGKDREPSAHFGDFYPALLEMGIYADVEILPTSYNYVYDSEEELLDWWAHHYSVEVDNPVLRTALTERAERRGETIGLYDQNRTALIAIDRRRSLFR